MCSSCLEHFPFVFCVGCWAPESLRTSSSSLGTSVLLDNSKARKDHRKQHLTGVRIGCLIFYLSDTVGAEPPSDLWGAIWRCKGLNFGA